VNPTSKYGVRVSFAGDRPTPASRQMTRPRGTRRVLRSPGPIQRDMVEWSVPMASGGKVYLETTVVSYLTARPSRDLRVAAHQQVTSEWWTSKRDQFDVYVSQLVLEEAAVGDEDAAARRLEQVQDIGLLALTGASLELAERLIADGAVPRDAQEDALHIAVAAVHGMDYLLTWNCRHIANATMRTRIQATCADAGYDAPVICTPEELLEE
jgi:hypothetical protein